MRASRLLAHAPDVAHGVTSVSAGLQQLVLGLGEDGDLTAKAFCSAALIVPERGLCRGLGDSHKLEQETPLGLRMTRMVTVFSVFTLVDRGTWSES